MTYDMWHVTCGGRWTFSQNVIFLSLALAVLERKCFEKIFTKDLWLTQLIIWLIMKVFGEQPRLHGVCKKLCDKKSYTIKLQ